MNTVDVTDARSSDTQDSWSSRLAGGTPATRRTLGLPVVYIGTLLGFAHLPETELYNLVAPVDEYPEGATITRATLEKLASRLGWAS
jgi:hypothetical protein